MKKSILNLTGKDGQIICASGIIDQRDDDSDTFGSERQLERVHEKKIRRAVRDAFNDKSIEDILNREDIEVVVEKDQDELDQAVIHHGQGGEHDQVLPGNDRFKQYDKIDGSGGGQGQGEPGDGDPGDGKASDSGETKDSSVSMFPKTSTWITYFRTWNCQTKLKLSFLTFLTYSLNAVVIQMTVNVKTWMLLKQCVKTLHAVLLLMCL